MKQLLTTLLIGASALAPAMSQESQLLYLSGKGIDDAKTWKFKCTDGMNAGKWGKIQVPCNWELQGYGEYTYGRYYHDRKGSLPSSEEGNYQTSFRVPADWSGQKVLLWFDGVMTDTEVKVNGKTAYLVEADGHVGQRKLHQGGFYRFAYDVTDLVKAGANNKLDVHVWKESANKSINAAERKADWWLFGGIYRPVWLEAMPKTCIQHVAIDARQSGDLTAIVQLDGNLSGYTITANVEGQKHSVRLGRSNNIALEMKCKGMKTWNPEQPNLYDFTLELSDPDGKVVHVRKERIGFRTIEFREGDGIYLNGVRLVVKGINRHSFWPEGGRATSPELSVKDAMLIKEMNMNAVRSHYPPDEHFLSACDSLGILYMDELAGWQNCVDDTIGQRILPEMIRRDVNHPCIYIWSNGNEGGFNYNLDNLFSTYDPQHRPVVHPWADWGGIDTHHYPAYLTGVGRFNNGSKVFMPTEFMHAMYDQGGGAGLKDFWDRWKQSPLFAGGYIWVFSDEAVVRTDKGGILDSDGSNAPDGVVGPYREKEGSYAAIREVWSPIQILPFRVTKKWNGIVYVKNDYLFTNLEGGKIVANGKSVYLPSIAPGETRAIRIMTDNLRKAEFLRLSCVSPSGEVVSTTVHPIYTPEEYFERQVLDNDKRHAANATTATAKVNKTDGGVELTSGGLSVRFDLTNGQISEIRKGEQTIPFGNGPISVGMKMKFNADKSVHRVERGRDGRDQAVFVARYQGGVDSIKWVLDADGRLFMDAVMLNRANGGGGFDDAFMDSNVKNLGLTFSYPDSICTGMKWMGRGPYRVWKNRLPGANFGIWHKDYNNTITGEVGVSQPSDPKVKLTAEQRQLQYPEFKGYHANLYWAEMESEVAPFKVYCQSENVYYRVFTPEEPAGRAGGKATMPAFPEGDLSFLLDIPAIQSFKPIEHQGPQSQPGNIRIKLGDDGLRIKLMFQF